MPELAGTATPPGIDGISFVETLAGGQIAKPHEYLYWDYGHCRDRYEPGRAHRQVERYPHWVKGSHIELYDLETDIGEKNNIAAGHPDMVKKMEAIMKEAVRPDDRYPVGSVYKGKPIWTRGVGIHNKSEALSLCI